MRRDRRAGTTGRWAPLAEAGGRWASANAPIVTAPAPAVEAAPVEQTLQAGELVILLVRPSVWMFVARALGATALAAAALATLWAFHALRGAVSPIVLTWLGLVLWSLADWRTRWYILTDRRVMAVRGLVRTSVCEMLLTSVCKVGASRIVGVLGIGAVTSFASHDGTRLVQWTMVRGPVPLRDRILEVVRRYGRRDAECAGPESSGSH